MMASLADIARVAKVSVKTVSGALNGGDIRMSEKTRNRIRKIAGELGYVPNLPARGMRQGVMPIISVIADEVITSPFATDIVRTLDEEVRKQNMMVFAMPFGSERNLEVLVNEARWFRPKRIAYAAMFHKSVAIPPELVERIDILINCFDPAGSVLSLVPDERAAGQTITNHLFGRGRRHLAFINLPGIIAGTMRLEGFVQAHREADLPWREDWILPATKNITYDDAFPSLVGQHVEALMALPDAPDGIVCGNDRVAMDVYWALARIGCRIPDDVAVGSFDNHVDIARRLDPPLTTMALPHAEMGALAARILLGAETHDTKQIKLPFRLVERQST